MQRTNSAIRPRTQAGELLTFVDQRASANSHSFFVYIKSEWESDKWQSLMFSYISVWSLESFNFISTFLHIDRAARYTTSKAIERLAMFRLNQLSWSHSISFYSVWGIVASTFSFMIAVVCQKGNTYIFDAYILWIAQWGGYVALLAPVLPHADNLLWTSRHEGSPSWQYPFTKGIALGIAFIRFWHAVGPEKKRERLESNSSL